MNGWTTGGARALHPGRKGSARSAATWATVAALAASAVLAGCTTGSNAAGSTEPPALTPPPPPPAACLLDTDALAADTGLRWTPDPTTASDTRCVYDPAGAPATDFVAVDVAPFSAPDPGAELDTLAQVCTAGSRAPAGEVGFVCRLQGDSVFAAQVRDEQVITLAASAVPPGTTAARLVAAFVAQLTAPG